MKLRGQLIVEYEDAVSVVRRRESRTSEKLGVSTVTRQKTVKTPNGTRLTPWLCKLVGTKIQIVLLVSECLHTGVG